MSPAIFDSPLAYRTAFEQGLVRMLADYDELGTFILVLANAGFDPDLWRRLAPQLRDKFERLADDIRAREACGHLLDDAGDDLVVFRQLMQLGIERLRTTEFSFLDPWELQFNPLRSLRPPRMTGATVSGIYRPFDPDVFNFNRPFLKKEILWDGPLGGRRCALFYNKFPFVDLHGLLVPEARRQRPQLLSGEDMDYLAELTGQLGRNLPGVGFGYNSYGAFASVNHLHFQFFLRERPLPVADPRWRHNGGVIDYPSHCQRFGDTAAAWRFIEQLHRQEVSYNLVLLPGCIYCLPRRKQGSYPQPAWTSGFAWYEMAGGFTTYRETDFAALDATVIEAELKGLSTTP